MSFPEHCIRVPVSLAESLRDGDAQAKEALRELGAAQLEYEDAKARYDAAAKGLKNASSLAREALGLQQKALMDALAELELHDGTWSYNPETGMMEKVEPSDGR